MLPVLAAVLLGGCAGTFVSGPEPVGDPEQALRDCRVFLMDLDREVASTGVGDAQAARIAGFPYLRVDRFHAALAPPPVDPAFEEWTARLMALDRHARSAEIANLGAGTRDAGTALLERVHACGERLRAADLRSSARRTALADAARVPDAYQDWKRALGLYPFTSEAFKAGVARLHAGLRRDFEVPLAALPVAGRVVRFAPAVPIAAADQTGALIAGASRGSLGVPDLDSVALDTLFAAHAPVLEVDVASDADRIGAPVWGETLPALATARAVAYRKLSWTRVGGEVLAQLSYVFWFPERPRSGAFDILGGRLDGITWRVTLDADGDPLLYDAMHNCGCYHMAFPGPRLRSRPPPRWLEEPLLVPQTILDGPGPLVVRVAHRTHYIQRVYRDAFPRPAGPEVRYALEDYEALRSLALPGGGRRSLFRPDGIVAGTERRERWLFWPMGVPEPGAMRQWGHHAVAFVGRRHFDDPDLVQRYFERVEDP